MITTTSFIERSKYIHKATTEAAIEVASNLREDDRRELVEGHGLDPMTTLLASINDGVVSHFTMPNGRTAALGGVQPGGIIWMVTTPAIYDYPITFAREAKRFLDSMKYPLLWNIVDKRNTVHLKLLRFLGFKFIREVTYGPNNLSFIEFCRVCNHNNRSSD